ncbi:MAG: hypothetical protein KBT33_10860 [Prevotellaceae bacterium]|nr:hypothetical protein [Candidatus Minthosoma equi]
MTSIKKVLCVITAAFASLCAFAAQWDKPVPVSCMPQNGSSYYLYNADAGKFFTSKGVQALLGSEGIAIEMTKLDNEDWRMTCGLGCLYSDVDYVGCDGDASYTNKDWCIEEQSGGVFHIRPSKMDPDYLWESYPDTWMGVFAENGTIRPLITVDEGAIDWYIIPEQDYAPFLSKVSLHLLMTELQGYGYDVSALLDTYNNTAADKAAFDAAIESVQDVLADLRIQNASENNPYDVTGYYLRNADLAEDWVDGGHDVPGWTMVPASFCGMGEFDNDGFYSDIKTLGSWASGAFGDNKIYQKITGLRNGKYKFGNYGLWIRHLGEEGDPITGGYIYAKVGDKIYKEPLTDTGWWRGLSEVTFECRTGEAEVGIMFEATNIGQCIILDFKLDYLGEKAASVRLSTLIENSTPLVEENAVNETYSSKLSEDIKNANALIASGDVDAQEVLFAVFLQDYEDAVANKEAYERLSALVDDAERIMSKGESDAMGALSDFLLENEFPESLDKRAFDNAKIQEIIKTLAELSEKAANSVVEAGTDVTSLLVNGHFDTTGGWVATLNDFSIDTSKKVMDKMWTDWKAEQVIKNVPNGTYRLEVQGFQWCSWDWAQSEKDWANGDKSATFNVQSKIRLNNDETTIHNVFACGPTDLEVGYKSADYYVPNDVNSALKFFELGLYDNMVETTVTDNTLKVEFDCSKQGFWNCFYNLRLTFIGANTKEAVANLKEAMKQADSYLEKKIAGDIRKEIENAKAAGEEIIADRKAKYDDINAAANAITSLFGEAEASIKTYARLEVALNAASETLQDGAIAATETGKQLNEIYTSVKADYDSDYPSLDAESVSSAVEQIEDLIAKAKVSGGFNEGDDITNLIANASFENTYGNDEALGNGAHTVPYGWTMKVAGKDCHTAQEISDAGINSWTAIEKNDYTTDGNYSYCLLSAPTPDAYLYQDVKGLPAGTYRVYVDLTVPFDGGCSRLTTQRLLVNNVAQYYGKAEDYKSDVLDSSYPEEKSRTFAGCEEVNSTLTGDAGDMGNMSTLSVEVTIADGESIVLGVRTDNNKAATNCNYDNNGWDCCGRYKLDNFRLVCVSLNGTGIESVKNGQLEINGEAYNLMGIKVDPSTARGIYIMNGKKYIK